jgi:hypothetical protein
MVKKTERDRILIEKAVSVSESGLDPDSIGSVKFVDTDSQPRSGYRKAQMAHQNMNKFQAALGIWNRMFFDLLDPDPLVRGTDPDTSIIKQKK